MSNGSPIIPDGWSQAFASLVMDEWTAALNGWKPPARDLPKKMPGRGAGVAAFLRAATEMPEPFELPADAGCKWAIVSSFQCALKWSSPEARLRAWAAVGAPVIPPPDGQIHAVVVFDERGKCVHARRFDTGKEAGIYSDALVAADDFTADCGVFTLHLARKPRPLGRGGSALFLASSPLR